MRALLGSLCWCPVLRVTRSQDMAWGQVWGTAQLLAAQDSLHPPPLTQRGQQSEQHFLLNLLQLLPLAVSLVSEGRPYFHSILSNR